MSIPYSISLCAFYHFSRGSLWKVGGGARPQTWCPGTFVHQNEPNFHQKLACRSFAGNGRLGRRFPMHYAQSAQACKRASTTWPFARTKKWIWWSPILSFTCSSQTTRLLSSLDIFIQLVCTPGTVKRWSQCTESNQILVSTRFWTLCSLTNLGSNQWLRHGPGPASDFWSATTPKTRHMSTCWTDRNSSASTLPCGLRTRVWLWEFFQYHAIDPAEA